MYTFWSMPAFRISCYPRISYLDVSNVEMMFLSSSSRSKREKKLRECNRTPTVLVFNCEIFRQFTRNFRRGRLSSRDLCMLTGCKVSIPEEIRESNPAHFDMSQDTWEVAGWKSDWVMGFDGIVCVRKRELVMKICVQNAEWWNFHPPFTGFLEWFNFDSVQIWKLSRCNL